MVNIGGGRESEKYEVKGDESSSFVVLRLNIPLHHLARVHHRRRLAYERKNDFHLTLNAGTSQ